MRQFFSSAQVIPVAVKWPKAGRGSCGQLQVHSAGSAPAREVDYLAVQAMAEKG